MLNKIKQGVRNLVKPKRKKKNKEECKYYSFVHKYTGYTELVYCTRNDYLFYKLYYGLGLTEEEHQEYRNYNKEKK
jgi:hypothetical protein